MDNELYNSYKNNSIIGGTSKRDPNRTINIKYKNYKRTITAVSLATAITVSGLIIGGEHLVNKIQNKITTGMLVRDFHFEYIAPETHRTDDNEHYFYDYDDIAKSMQESEDFQEAVYLLIKDLGEYQTDKVLQYTEYKDLNTFLETNNWKNQEAFIKDIEKRISLENDIKNEQRQLDKMFEKHNMLDNDENIYGGIKK